MYQSSGDSWTHTFTEVGTYRIDWFVKDPGNKAFDENDSNCKDSGGGTWDKCGSVSVKVIKGRWNPTPTVFTLEITEPDSGDYCKAGETLACSAKAADTDTYIKCGETSGTQYSDKIGDWEWTISPAKGSIAGNGSSATYTAPADVTEGEQVTITASADDEAKMDADDGGSRKDGRKSDSVTIKLTKKVRVWSPAPSDIDPEVTSPGSGSEAGPDEKFVCKASATDSDHWYFEDDPNVGGDSADEIPDDNYTWTCSKGSFVGGDNKGSEVVWQAPPADQITDNPNGETVTFTVTVDDKPLPVPTGDKGGRDDGAKSDQGTLTLKKKVKTWTPQTNDSEKLWVSIQSPASGDLVKGGEAITVSADGGDKDHWKYNDNTGEGSEEDSVDYEWSGPGSFSPTTGKSTSWTPPNTPGNATIKVEADDKPLPPPPEDNYNKGSREDGTDDDSVTVKVDADTPVVNITAIDPSYDSGAKKYVPASFRVDVSATDEVGLKSVSCDPPGQTREYSKPGPKSASESFNVTGQTDGDKTITATAKDWVDHEGSASQNVTVDATPPESAVNPLPETVSTTTFQVSWGGTDSGSGIKDYDVQVKVDSEGWQDWLTGTTAQTAQFTGERGHRYCFQCRARDNIGNEEQYPGGDGDTCTNLRTYWVEIKACPDYFVPGHENIIKYRIYPDTYTALYGKLEIFERGGSGQPTGPALYSSTELSLNGGTEHSFQYFGDGLSEGSGGYIVKLSIGPDAFSVSTDQEAFDVRAWALVTFFWDDLTIEDKAEMIATDQEPCDPGYVEAFDPLAFDSNSGLPPYCTGVDYTTVTSAEVAVTTWYWDETEYDADSLWIDNGTPTESISDTDWVDVWGQDPLDKPWYDERGSSITDLNGRFYSMSQSNQYFYLKMAVATEGILDNVGNEFDANPDTPQREGTITYRLKIDGNGNVTILEEVYE